MSGASVVLVLGAVVVVVALLPSGRARAGDDGGDEVVARLRAGRRRAVLCLVLAVALLAGGVVIGTSVPQLLGLPLAVAPGLAATAALLGFVALPVRAPVVAGPVTASLARRTAWSYGSPRAFALPGVLALATLALLAWAASVASPDEQGRARAFALTDVGMSSSAGPFPGGFYGGPLAVVTVLLAGATYVALRRVAGTPTLPRSDQADADRRWRTASTRLVLRLALAALLGQLGAVAVFAGRAVHSAAASIAAMGGRQDPAGLAGAVLALLGVALLLLAAVAAALAVRQVVALSAAGRDRGTAPSVAPVAP